MAATALKQLHDEILTGISSAYAKYDAERQAILARYGTSQAGREKVTEAHERYFPPIREKVRRFNEQYPEEMLALSKKVEKESTPAHEETPAFFAKMQLWFSIYQKWTVEKLKAKYLEEIEKGNDEFMYFIERVFYPSIEATSNVLIFKSHVDRMRAERISENTRKELELMKGLNRAFMTAQSLGQDWNFENLRYFFQASGQQINKNFSTIFEGV